MKKYYIGIDNGTTGSIGVIDKTGSEYFLYPAPAIKQQDYTKKVKNITRYDRKALREIFTKFGNEIIKAVIERPLKNPKLFNATISAIRSFECLECILEDLQIPYIVIDSKKWQKEMLPLGTKGNPNLKKASMDIGLKLFPEHRELIKKRKEADGILIAEYARRIKL